MWFIDDIVINDINWYEVTLIENDVVIKDDIDNNWYEMMLLFMIILIWDDIVIDDCVDNVIEMRWCWCR